MTRKEYDRKIQCNKFDMDAECEEFRAIRRAVEDLLPRLDGNPFNAHDLAERFGRIITRLNKCGNRADLIDQRLESLKYIESQGWVDDEQK